MNAQHIWAGSDYAYVQYRRRGVEYYPNAKRVRVKRVYKQSIPGGERDRTMVEVWPLTDDGGYKIGHSGERIIQHVKARQITHHWDDYVYERKHIEEERAAKEREEEDKRRQQRVRKQRILDALSQKGLDTTRVVVYESFVQINTRDIEKWLGLDVTAQITTSPTAPQAVTPANSPPAGEKEKEYEHDDEEEFV